MALLFRVDVSKLRRKMQRMKRDLSAAQMARHVDAFVRRSLATAAKITPVRELAVIRENQIGKEDSQFDAWVAGGITRASGGGNASKKKRNLNKPRRRLNKWQGITRSVFLAARAPARFLYKASWGHIARSLGMQIPESANVMAATTRRNPSIDPPMGHGIRRGGQSAYRIDIYNPFLEIPSQYKSFTGKQILRTAMLTHLSQFRAAVAQHISKVCRKASAS